MPQSWSATTAPAELYSPDSPARTRQRRRRGMHPRARRLVTVVIVNLCLIAAGIPIAHFVVARFIAS